MSPLPEPTEWVAWTWSGYYASSLNGDRLTGFHVNRRADKAADFYDSTQFFEKLYRPDIVRLAFRLSSEEAAISEASKKRRTEKVGVAQILLPRVCIVSTSDRTTVKEVSVTLEATATPPPDGNVEEVIVKVNGRGCWISDSAGESAGRTALWTPRVSCGSCVKFPWPPGELPGGPRLRGELHIQPRLGQGHPEGCSCRSV